MGTGAQPQRTSSLHARQRTPAARVASNSKRVVWPPVPVPLPSRPLLPARSVRLPEQYRSTRRGSRSGQKNADAAGDIIRYSRKDSARHASRRTRARASHRPFGRLMGRPALHCLAGVTMQDWLKKLSQVRVCLWPRYGWSLVGYALTNLQRPFLYTHVCCIRGLSLL